MKLTIQEKQENVLLHRTDVQARIFFEAQVPTRLAVADELAKEVKHDRKLVVVSRIKPSFGETVAMVDARLYTDEQTMRSVERDNLLAKHAPPKKERPTEQPQQEAPHEEKQPDEQSSDAAAPEESPGDDASSEKSGQEDKTEKAS